MFISLNKLALVLFFGATLVAAVPRHGGDDNGRGGDRDGDRDRDRGDDNGRGRGGRN